MGKCYECGKETDCIVLSKSMAIKIDIGVRSVEKTLIVFSTGEVTKLSRKPK